MSMLVIQVVLKQWDKGQRSEAHIRARSQRPDRYPVTDANASYLSDHRIVLDQHGDDVMGNRLRYELTDDSKFIIDRFGFDLKSGAVVHFPQPDSMLPPEHIATLNDGWMQCRYEWRYKVYEGGFHYWLYEAFILNAAFVANLEQDMFMTSAPVQVFNADKQ